MNTWVFLCVSVFEWMSLSDGQCLFVLCIKKFVGTSVLGFQSLDYCVCVSVCLNIIVSVDSSVPVRVCLRPFDFCGSVCPCVPVNAGVLCVG